MLSSLCNLTHLGITTTCEIGTIIFILQMRKVSPKKLVKLLRVTHLINSKTGVNPRSWALESVYLNMVGSPPTKSQAHCWSAIQGDVSPFQMVTVTVSSKHQLN